MDDKVVDLHDPEAGVVDFGVAITGYTAIVEGRQIPGLMVKERGKAQITIILDNRWEIDVPREQSGKICWMIANALAIGEGYSHLGALSKNHPFAPSVIGPYGPPPEAE